MTDRQVIGLALSGGGFRASAFHLGCLRALHDRDLLERVQVVSGVSGGALLAALWAYGPEDFGQFDAEVVELLRHGLQGEMVRRVFRPAAIVRNMRAATATAMRILPGVPNPPLARRANRTDALAVALQEMVFADKTMPSVTHPHLRVVLSATDLYTTNAVRFGSARSSCSRYGTITEPIRVASAVAASAAFPLFLPAVEREYTFERDDRRQRETVLLTDGGVYDNLGLSIFDPNRSTAFSEHVERVPYIVCCDAGRGQMVKRSPHFLPARAKRAFEVVHRKAQDAARSRLHEWAANGQIQGFVMAYLGMNDSRLPMPIADLVPRADVADYGTNFSAMSATNVDRLARRGEQLVRALLPYYCPELC
ncbi:patatin-like phospholipase family protein [Amycolatopsis sp. RTGN1]|uniref:patatin-like phospholipase family protein n=1 Tax=Amycolatopsis ponsaeliensis TaxID=2992142 RepID=UPI00254D272D|nr:patatin-like phospholipase family protein [Amycolatopsis sp. RTGN1]